MCPIQNDRLLSPRYQLQYESNAVELTMQMTVCLSLPYIYALFMLVCLTFIMFYLYIEFNNVKHLKCKLIFQISSVIAFIFSCLGGAAGDSIR